MLLVSKLWLVSCIAVYCTVYFLSDMCVSGLLTSRSHLVSCPSYLQEDAIEETGWKLVHGDVFRPPSHVKLFSAVVGTGVQLLSMFVITLGRWSKRVW